MRDQAAAPRAGNRSLTAHRSILSLFQARNAAHVVRGANDIYGTVCVINTKVI